MKTTAKNKQVLKMTNKTAQSFVMRQAKHYVKTGAYGRNVDIGFVGFLKLGDGATEYMPTGHSRILIGISPFDEFAGDMPIEDMDVIKLDTTLSHEIRHHEQLMDSDTPNEILLSSLSVNGNTRYYKTNWHKLPHEIDAEHISVMSTWHRMEQRCPEHANKLMLERLTDRAKNSTYILEAPNGRFIMKTQIDRLFVQAEKTSPYKKRALPNDFLTSGDEVAQMITEGTRAVLPEYYGFYDQLMKEPSGRAFDQKLASLVAYIHPELPLVRKLQERTEINPSRLFGLPMPRTIEEVKQIVTPSDTVDIFARNIEILEDGTMDEDRFSEAVRCVTSTDMHGIVMM